MRVLSTWLSKKPRASAWFVATWATILLFAGCFVYWQDFFMASSWMPASYQKVFVNNEYWRLWTTLLAHANMGHLLSNSLLFLIFGYFLSGYFGFIVFPLAAFLVGGLSNGLVLLFYPPEVHLIGVSGVVYWMGAVWLTLFLFIDETRSRGQRGLRAIGVALAVFMPSAAFDPQISYLAHLSGFLFGIGFGSILYFLRRDLFKSALIYEIPSAAENPQD